jgi:hypothetical protein
MFGNRLGATLVGTADLVEREVLGGAIRNVRRWIAFEDLLEVSARGSGFRHAHRTARRRAPSGERSVHRKREQATRRVGGAPGDPDNVYGPRGDR